MPPSLNAQPAPENPLPTLRPNDSVILANTLSLFAEPLALYRQELSKGGKTMPDKSPGQTGTPVSTTSIDHEPISRRQFVMAGTMTAAGATALLALPKLASGSPAEGFVYVGSYTKDPPGGGSDNPVGLSVFRVEQPSGTFTLIQQVPSANPSFVALDPSQRFLYVVNEIDDYQGEKAGSAEAYAINPGSGTIALLNRQSVMGTIPAHLAVDPTGRYVVVANYTGGNFVSMPIEADGRLGPVAGTFANKGG